LKFLNTSHYNIYNFYSIPKSVELNSGLRLLIFEILGV